MKDICSDKFILTRYAKTYSYYELIYLKKKQGGPIQYKFSLASIKSRARFLKLLVHSIASYSDSIAKRNRGKEAPLQNK